MDVHLKLGLMLQSRAKYTVFVVCQSYQRGIFRMVLKLSLHHHQVGSSNAGAPETSAKSGTLFLL